MANQSTDQCYIGKCVCGGIVFAGVDRPEHRKDNASDIADLMRRGFTVERVAVEAARTGKWCLKSKEHMRG